jgi:hypothetical protein
MLRPVPYAKSPSGLYVVRSYDWSDHIWTDVSRSVTEDEALRLWNQKTRNGTENARYEHGDYYAIFPADTRMLYSAEAGYDHNLGLHVGSSIEE